MFLPVYLFKMSKCSTKTKHEHNNGNICILNFIEPAQANKYSVTNYSIGSPTSQAIYIQNKSLHQSDPVHEY